MEVLGAAGESSISSVLDDNRFEADRRSSNRLLYGVLHQTTTAVILAALARVIIVEP